MKTLLLTIGFVFGGILTSFAPAQVIPLTIDSTQSSVDVSFEQAATVSSALSGTASLDLQFSGPPSGNAQINDLSLVFDDAFSTTFATIATIFSSPGGITLSMETPGAPGTISGNSFDQLSNSLALTGELNVVDPFGFIGGNQAFDLSAVDISPLDFNSITVSQLGDLITVTSSITINDTINFGTGPVAVEMEVTYVANGIVPASVLPGDVSMDGVVNCFDISPFIMVLISGGFQAEADIDQSSSVNFLDIRPFIPLVMNP